jgi:hypothetical protein
MTTKPRKTITISMNEEVWTKDEKVKQLFPHLSRTDIYVKALDELLRESVL